MKEMCLPCYGTGQIRCLVCGGTGVMPNIGLLGEDCRKCKGSRKGRCPPCRGSGFIGGAIVPSQYPTEAMIDLTLADSFPASDPPSWTRGLDNLSGLSAAVASLIEVPKEAINARLLLECVRPKATHASIRPEVTGVIFD